MFGFSLPHLLVFLVIIVLVFGTKKLSNVGRDLGDAVRGFKEGMNGGASTSGTATTSEPPAGKLADGSTIDVEIKEKSRV